ncbi:MAG: hypothetical protein ACTSWJ_07905, partial [Candidatus Heimdallarchaeaceae archaeon]
SFSEKGREKKTNLKSIIIFSQSFQRLLEFQNQVVDIFLELAKGFQIMLLGVLLHFFSFFFSLAKH